jgi:hypothetical protein
VFRWGNLKEKDHLADPDIYICEDNIKLCDKEYDGMGWIGLFWYEAGAVGGLL